MQVYNTFFKIAKKHIGLGILYVVIFLSLVTCMSLSTKADNEEMYENKKHNVMVIDKCQSEKSKKLFDYIDSIHNIKDYDTSKDSLQDLLYTESVKYILIIDKDYETNGKLTHYAAEGSNFDYYITAQIDNYEKSMAAFLSSGKSIDDAYALTLKALDTDGLVNMLEKDKSNGMLYYYFLYFPYLLLMVMLSIFTPILSTINSKEIKDRTSVSSLSAKNQNFQILLATIVYSLLIFVVFMIASFFFKQDFPFGKQYLLLTVASLVFTLFGASIATLIGNFNIKNEVISIISNVAALGLAFLGGIFVPYEIFNDTMKTISHFTPTYWFYKVLNLIFDNGSLSSILQCFGIILLFSLVCIAISMVISKRIRVSQSS